MRLIKRVLRIIYFFAMLTIGAAIGAAIGEYTIDNSTIIQTTDVIFARVICPVTGVIIGLFLMIALNRKPT